MTKLTQYADAFWGAEFLSTAGSDALSKHNSEEKKFLQDFEEYLRKSIGQTYLTNSDMRDAGRSKMELEYSKSLGQLSRSLKERTAVGMLEAAWNTLRSELDTCRQAHDDTGYYFAQHAEETKRFCKDLNARRDSVEDRLKRAQNQKSSQFKNVTSLSKTYRQKCREKDLAKDQYDILRREVTSTVKELDKARAKKDKTEDEANKADQAYKNGVFALEDVRQEWEKEMDWACKECQNSDEEQITNLRSEMWMAVNRISQAAVDVDESSERVRKVLETCNVNQDIQNFIAQNSTGTEIPAPVLYQNYYETGGASVGGGGGGGGGGNSRTALASSGGDGGHQRSVAPVPSMGNHGSSAFYSLAHDADDPTYSMAADPTYSSADPLPDLSIRQLTVCKSFQNPQNFSVQMGERVTFVRRVNANMVEVKTHMNRVGLIPLTCIKESV